VLREECNGSTHALALIEKPLPASNLLLLDFGHECRKGAMEEIGDMMNNYILLCLNALYLWHEQFLALL